MTSPRLGGILLEDEPLDFPYRDSVSQPVPPHFFVANDNSDITAQLSLSLHPFGTVLDLFRDATLDALLLPGDIESKYKFVHFSPVAMDGKLTTSALTHSICFSQSAKTSRDSQ